MSKKQIQIFGKDFCLKKWKRKVKKHKNSNCFQKKVKLLEVIGDLEGKCVGIWLGLFVGAIGVGLFVGEVVGRFEENLVCSWFVGEFVEKFIGNLVGCWVGSTVGAEVVGSEVGSTVGAEDVGSKVGAEVVGFVTQFAMLFLFVCVFAVLCTREVWVVVRFSFEKMFY